MPKFVIQQHTHEQQTHWDFMLEQTGRLATWQINLPPAQWADEPIFCKKIADHRMIYLTYDGPISGNRGSVNIVDKGTYEPTNISSEQWRIRIQGDIIQGRLELNLIENDQWRLALQADSRSDQGDNR